MSGDKVKVVALAGAYAFEGVSYGPFQASKETPFLLVPATLAAALNLPLHPDEVKAREEAQAEQEQDGEGISVDEILKANQDLKADFDRVAKERDDARAKVASLEEGAVLLRKSVEKWSDLANSNGAHVTNLTLERDKLAADLTAAQARITELESQQQPTPPETPAQPAEQQQGTPLPDGTPLRGLLTQHGFTTLEGLEAGLQVADGETESQVQKIDGVGKKTVEAYHKLIADWKAGQQ